MAQAVVRDITCAMRLADDAQTAYRLRDPRAGALRHAAELAHSSLLTAICLLSDHEADLIESPFTEFEQRLRRLRAW